LTDQYPVLNVEFDNERQSNIYRFETVVNCSARRLEPVIENIQAEVTEEVTDNITDEEPTEDVSFSNSISTEIPIGPVTQNWRLISAVKAWPNSSFVMPQLVDYGHDGGETLKKIVDLVNVSRPDLIWNHSNDAHDVCGYVTNASWEDSDDIPVGVNAQLYVNPDFDKKAAVGLQDGILRNGSIGVVMDCQPSHPNMKFSKFLESQGQTVNGNEVRWLPIDVKAVRHMAIVQSGAGADPNAGRRNIMTDNTKAIDEIVENTDTTEEIIENTITEETKETSYMEEHVTLLSNLVSALGVEAVIAENEAIPEDLQERLVTKISKYAEYKDRVNTLGSMLDEAKKIVGAESNDVFISTLNAKVALSEHGEKLLGHFRKEAVKWFDSAKAALGKAELSESEKRMRSRIEVSEDLDYLEDMVTEYRDITESTLSVKRVSEGSDLPKDKPTVSQKDKDIAASVAALYR
jgi:hypothetical protein